MVGFSRVRPTAHVPSKGNELEHGGHTRLVVGLARECGLNVRPHTKPRAERIEEFLPSQARALVELWRESFEHGVGITDPNPLEDQLAYFHSTILPRSRVRVALESSALVGFIASTPESIECLYVAVPSIGRGIGSRLLKLAKAESAGSLWLYTFAQNRNARAF